MKPYNCCRNDMPVEGEIRKVRVLSHGRLFGEIIMMGYWDGCDCSSYFMTKFLPLLFYDDIFGILYVANLETTKWIIIIIFAVEERLLKSQNLIIIEDFFDFFFNQE